MRAVVLIAIPIFAGLLGSCAKKPAPVPPASVTPLIQRAAKLQLHAIYANPAARPALAPLGKALASAPPDDSAARDPKAWRRLDRAHRFDGVLLAGPTADFQPLLEHLAASPDFCIDRIAPAGVLFVRGTPMPYPIASARDAARDFDGNDRAVQLSRLALLLEMVGEHRAAREYAAAAVSADSRDATARVGVAAVAFAQKDYPRALEEAATARSLDPGNLGALDVMARTLAAAGNADAAWQVASELRQRAPEDDMNVLFLHARIANAARAFADEQASLERLVALAESRHLPVTDFRVYLGQCYARQGLARPALHQLEAAAVDPALTEQQRADVATALATVRARAGRMQE